jgi:hypothetical protein
MKKRLLATATAISISFSAFAGEPEQLILCRECNKLFSVSSPVKVVHQGTNHIFVPWVTAKEPETLTLAPPIPPGMTLVPSMPIGELMGHIQLLEDRINRLRSAQEPNTNTQIAVLFDRITNLERLIEYVVKRMAASVGKDVAALPARSAGPKFKKECAECGEFCESTTIHAGSGGHATGETVCQDSTVEFHCRCGFSFNETLHHVIRKTAPMVEVK